MEAFLVQTFGADAPLLAAFGNRPILDWWYPQGVLGEGGIPAEIEKPYMQWAELEPLIHREVRKTSNSKTRTFQLFIYDDKGDFTRINRILRHLERIVKAMGPFEFTDEDGTVHWCSESDWAGISGSMTDDQYHTTVRYGTARFTVSEH